MWIHSQESTKTQSSSRFAKLLTQRAEVDSTRPGGQHHLARGPVDRQEQRMGNEEDLSRARTPGSPRPLTTGRGWGGPEVRAGTGQLQKEKMGTHIVNEALSLEKRPACPSFLVFLSVYELNKQLKT